MFRLIRPSGINHYHMLKVHTLFSKIQLALGIEDAFRLNSDPGGTLASTMLLQRIIRRPTLDSRGGKNPASSRSRRGLGR